MDNCPKEFWHLLDWRNGGFAYLFSESIFFGYLVEQASIIGLHDLGFRAWQGYQALFATASSNDTLPKSTTSFGNIHCKSTSRAHVFVQN